MIDWRIAEALEADTREAVARWWARRRRRSAAPIPDGLVADLQTARLALDEGLQRRLWDLATILPEPQRSEFITETAEVDPWRVLSEMAARRALPDPVAGERQAASKDDRDLIAVLKGRARRRERLERPEFPNKARRRLRDLVHGRGSLAAVLRDDDTCRMLRFGAVLCGLIEVDLGVQAEPDPDNVRAGLAKLGKADVRRAADAVLGDPLVGSDDRGRPAEAELLAFVQAVICAVATRTGHQLAPTIARATASSGGHDVPGPDTQLILDLFACHAPSKTMEAVADLIKNARSPKGRR
jgi:hypothetical protein